MRSLPDDKNARTWEPFSSRLHFIQLLKIVKELSFLAGLYKFLCTYYFACGVDSISGAGWREMRGQVASLIEDVEKVEDVPSGDEFLCLVQDLFDAKNIAYLCLNLPKPTYKNYCIQHSHSSEWKRFYASENFADADSFLKQGITSIIPLDWSRLEHLSPSEQDFFAAAREMEVGRQGLTFTVRGRFGEAAIFSVNTDHNDHEWSSFKFEYMSDLHVIATYFHEKILRSQGLNLDSKTCALSGRELECLKWCTAGKSYWETAVILGISERTVNFHMTTVRQKLNAMTNAQAVAKAIIQGITTPGI